MTFQDIFKSSFLESFSSFSLTDTLLSLAAAFLIGLFIYFVYRKIIQRCPLQPQFQRIPHCHTAGDLSGHPRCNQQCGIVFGYGRCPVYRAFPYGSERPHGFGIFVLGNRRRHPLWRFFAAFGNFGMPPLSVFSCWYSPIVSRQIALTCLSSVWTAWKVKAQ